MKRVIILGILLSIFTLSNAQNEYYGKVLTDRYVNCAIRWEPCGTDDSSSIQTSYQKCRVKVNFDEEKGYTLRIGFKLDEKEYEYFYTEDRPSRIFYKTKGISKVIHSVVPIGVIRFLALQKKKLYTDDSRIIFWEDCDYATIDFKW